MPTMLNDPNDSAGRLTVAQLIESDGPGGAERIVARLARGLEARGIRSVVFVPENGEGWLAGQLKGSGVVVDHFRLTRPVSPACARSLAAAFLRHGIAVAHSHEFSMAVYGAWASRLAGIAHVITMHGGRYYAGRLQRRLAMRLAIAASRRTVAVSASVARDLRRDLRLAESRIFTIPNGVQFVPAEPSALRHELCIGHGDPLLVSVGNLYPVKGHQHLIDALALLIPRYPALHVAISGRGELAGALTARAHSLGLAAHVHLLGLRSDVAAILAAADVFVLPSLSEGLPLALLEAMLARRPIVASDVGEVGTALAHGDAGILVPPGNPAELAAALDRVLSDPHRSRMMGERAASRAAAEYGESRMIRRYASLYDEVLNRTSSIARRESAAGADVCLNQ
jgi:glycosyltransferase involved in cell wall biosynthesis